MQANRVGVVVSGCKSQKVGFEKLDYFVNMQTHAL